MATVTEQLEALVDAHDLTHVLAGLSLVCSDRAALIRSGVGGDTSPLTARHWDKAAGVIEAAARNVPTSI